MNLRKRKHHKIQEVQFPNNFYLSIYLSIYFFLYPSNVFINREKRQDFKNKNIIGIIEELYINFGCNCFKKYIGGNNLLNWF